MENSNPNYKVELLEEAKEDLREMDRKTTRIYEISMVWLSAEEFPNLFYYAPVRFENIGCLIQNLIELLTNGMIQ